MEVLSFEVTGKPAASQIFVFINSLGTARRLEVEQKLEFWAILILDWTVVIFVSSEMLFFRLPEIGIPWQSSGSVDRDTCRTPQFSHAQAWYSTDNTCSLAQGSSLSFTRRGHPSTRHVSSCASRYTEHQHKFSPTYLSFFTVVFFSEPILVVHASTYPLWGSTAGWYFHGIPLLHRVWAQKDRAQQYSG